MLMCCKSNLLMIDGRKIAATTLSGTALRVCTSVQLRTLQHTFVQFYQKIQASVACQYL